MIPKDKRIYFKNSDGLKLCGILTTPQISTNKCVILCHGITVDKDEDGNFPTVAENLRRAGFNVARFDFRGHGESGGELINMTIEGEIDDLSSFLSFLKKRGYAKFALLGASFGAVASISYCADHSDISCLVLWYPVLDLKRTFLSRGLPWARKSFNEKGSDI